MPLAEHAEGVSSCSLGEQVLLLLSDDESRRFLSLCAAFVIMMQLSCVVEEWIYTQLPGFKEYNKHDATQNTLFLTIKPEE